NELGGSEFYRNLLSVIPAEAGIPTRNNTQGTQVDAVIGGTYDEDNKLLGANIPKADFKEAEKQIYTLTDLIAQEKILAAHDISEGGLAACLAEMCMPHQKTPQADISIKVDISNIKNELEDYQTLFSETPGFVLEVSDKYVNEVVEVFKDNEVDIWDIGETSVNKECIVISNNKTLIQSPLKDLQNLWINGLREKI
ncbi:hypothetical protein HON22_05740, partial [Candidatus Peregrinibacteria bacterium]|nr:hypothetical protein [Candidatus Peregrinibacteria bacterium]